MQPTTTINCPNCGQAIAQTYCPNCGQSYTADKLTVWQMLKDMLTNLFTVERSVFGLMWLIIIKPREIIESYWNGFRNYYASPGKLVLYAVTILGLHFAFVNTKVLGITVDAENFAPQLILLLVLVPVYFIIIKLAFLRSGHSFAEQIVAFFYLFSTWIIVFTILFDILYYVLGSDALENQAFIIFNIPLMLWLSRVLSRKNKWYVHLGKLFLQLAIMAAIIFVLWWLNRGEG